MGSFDPIGEDGRMSSAAAFLNARARALIGTIMPTEAILELAELPTVEAIARRLESEGYFRQATDAEERLTPVQALWSQLDGIYRAAITVVSGPGRAVVRAMFGQREAQFLKAALGCAYRGVPATERRRYVGGLHLFNRSIEPDLLEAADLAEAVARAPDPYRQTLQNALHRVEEEGSLFAIEMGLDLFVLHEMWLAVRKLSGAERAHVGAIMGAWFDVYNLSAAVRLREIFHVSSDETLGYLIHHGLYLFLSQRRALAAAESFPQIIAVANGTPYEPFLRDVKELGEVEHEMMRAFRNVIDAQLSGYPFHLGSTVAYLFLKTMEIRNLTHIYEATRWAAKDVPLGELMTG